MNGRRSATGGILPYLYPIDVGIQRNTAAVSYRATDPWMSWDAGADYSYMTRTGTQPAGIVEFQGFAPTNVPAPVDDSTQNFGAKGEYIGTSLWGQKLTFKAAYTGSIYTDNISSYTVQNPFSLRRPLLGSCALYETYGSGGGYGELRQRPDVDLAQQSNERRSAKRRRQICLGTAATLAQPATPI